jgi:hypothetical protein
VTPELHEKAFSTSLWLSNVAQILTGRGHGPERGLCLKSPPEGVIGRYSHTWGVFWSKGAMLFPVLPTPCHKERGKWHLKSAQKENCDRESNPESDRAPE